MSHPIGKPTICICENKDADQLRGKREADQRLCFRYSDSTITLLLKSEISSFWLFSVLVQAGLCRTCSETTLLVFPRGGSNSYVAPVGFIVTPQILTWFKFRPLFKGNLNIFKLYISSGKQHANRLCAASQVKICQLILRCHLDLELSQTENKMALPKTQPCNIILMFTAVYIKKFRL